jgi:hypothetical protein
MTARVIRRGEAPLVNGLTLALGNGKATERTLGLTRASPQHGSSYR